MRILIRKELSFIHYDSDFAADDHELNPHRSGRAKLHEALHQSLARAARQEMEWRSGGYGVEEWRRWSGGEEERRGGDGVEERRRRMKG